MNTQALVLERATIAPARAADYLELTKPRIGLLVLVTVAVGSWLASWGPPNPYLLLHTLLGTALVAASASALNQWLEQSTDACMARTANRPLPAGKLSVRQVLVFGTATFLAGGVHLALCVGPATAFWAAATWVLYVWVYTPLKARTSANTAVGAVAGALPVLIGWSAAGGALDVRVLGLLVLVFLWQFPHFMAIAWIYRHDYASAGLQMLTVVDATGRRAGAQAVVAALALVPVSLVPQLWGLTAPQYFGWAMLLGLAQLGCAANFLWKLDDASARLLLRASLVYLPAVLLLLVLQPWV